MGSMKVFIGWDSSQKQLYDICRYSLLKNIYDDDKIEIFPLIHHKLREQGFFERLWGVNPFNGKMFDIKDKIQFRSEFSYTRFLVPAILNYKGWALYCDPDMLWMSNANIEKLFGLRDESKAVMVVKHDYNGKSLNKYNRKNWSSFILFNCGHPSNKKLTIESINRNSAAWLHSFSWLNDEEIGELPKIYNWISGISPSNISPAVIHFTDFDPSFSADKNIPYISNWWENYQNWIDNGEFTFTKDIMNTDYRRIK